MGTTDAAREPNRFPTPLPAADDVGAEPASASASLARGAALITLAAAVSRVTGFVRVMVVASALGTTFLANTYQTANSAPNLVFELVAAGVLTSVFVPTFVEYITRGRKKEGWDAANALTSVALVGLIALAVVLGLAAPLVMRALTIGVRDAELRRQEIALGSDFLRLFAPQVVFYGVGMIMTGALHAHRRFGVPSAAPIFNNLVVIAVYLTYAAMRGNDPPTVDGITDSQTFVLGAGTTLGVVAMTISLVPQLARLGWRFRFSFKPSHPAVRRGARLGVWALGYAGGYQAGLVVVLVLANRVEGGVAAYQWAYTFFYLPHALVGIPIFHVLFTAMAEHAALQDNESLLERLRDGLAMLGFVLLPVAAVLVVASGPLARITLDYGVMTGTGADLVGRVLAAFAIGLPGFSVFLVLTRAFYALGNTRTPALYNAATAGAFSVLGAVLFAAATTRWSVPALALAHSVAFSAGALALGASLGRRVGTIRDARFARGVVAAGLGALIALAVMLAVRAGLPTESKVDALVNLAATCAAGAAVYILVMHRLKSRELRRVIELGHRLRR